MKAIEFENEMKAMRTKFRSLLRNYHGMALMHMVRDFLDKYKNRCQSKFEIQTIKENLQEEINAFYGQML